jgi:hypothetical protein
MEQVLTLLSAAGPASLALALVVMGLLSQRLGAVTKMPSHYRWFFVAAGWLGVAVAARLLALGDAGKTLALIYVLSVTLGSLIGVLTAWRYWSWLFGERSL